MVDIFFKGSNEPIKAEKVEFEILSPKYSFKFPFPRNHEFKLKGKIDMTWDSENFFFGKDPLQ